MTNGDLLPADLLRRKAVVYVRQIIQDLDHPVIRQPAPTPVLIPRTR